MLSIETTTTTESMQIDTANFVITTYEQTTTAFCDICGEQETGSQQGLRNQGWHLGQREQFCPSCNL